MRVSAFVGVLVTSLVACGGIEPGGDPSADAATDAVVDSVVVDSAVADTAIGADAPDTSSIDASPPDARPDVAIDTSPPCDFVTVQAILSRNCAVSGCHVLPTPPQGLNLEPGSSYKSLVDVPSVEVADYVLVKPGDSAHSSLYLDLEGLPPYSKPLPGLTAAERASIECWIDDGALP